MTAPVDFISDYKISGKVLLLPINGEGKSKVIYGMSGEIFLFECIY